MNQKQINQQHLRIAKAVTKAYQSIEQGLISLPQFNSKLSVANAARRTLAISQFKFDERGY